MHDSEVDVQRGTLTLNTNVTLDIRPKASGLASLYSPTGQRGRWKYTHSGRAFESVALFPRFFSSLPAESVGNFPHLPFKSQYLPLPELPSTRILCPQFSQGEKYSCLRMKQSS